MQKTVTKSILDSDSLTAKIVWALKCFMHGYSYNSNRDMNEIVRVIFPESNISNLGAEKIRYLVNLDLAPYFKDKLVEDVDRYKFLPVDFNESLNCVTHICQMYLAVRFWDVNRVQVRYWDSSFMGHTTTNDLLQQFTNITEAMNYSNIIHLSMDGSSVIHKFYRDLKEYREKEKLPEMTSFRSFNLYILHGAFKSGFESTDWEMEVLLKSCYQVLHDSPAPRDDYVSIKKSTKFPLAFCCTRWVEDKTVVDRLLEIWLYIMKTIR